MILFEIVTIYPFFNFSRYRESPDKTQTIQVEIFYRIATQAVAQAALLAAGVRLVPRSDADALRLRPGQVLERRLPPLLRAQAAPQLHPRRARHLPRPSALRPLRQVN